MYLYYFIWIIILVIVVKMAVGHGGHVWWCRLGLMLVHCVLQPVLAALDNSGGCVYSFEVSLAFMWFILFTELHILYIT